MYTSYHFATAPTPPVDQAVHDAVIDEVLPEKKEAPKPVAAAPRSATRAAVTSSAPPAAAPTVDIRGGSDMFEDLVIMSSRPRARDAAAA